MLRLLGERIRYNPCSERQKPVLSPLMRAKTRAWTSRTLTDCCGRGDYGGEPLAGNRLLNPLNESATLTALFGVRGFVATIPPCIFQFVLTAVPVVASVRTERQGVK